MKDKQYYIKTYLILLKNAEKVSKLNGWDYEATVSEYELNANTDEVVGYYLLNEKDNALKQWRDNISHIKKLSAQDLEVTKILERFFDK